MQSTTIAVDLAKSVFEVAVSERPGQVAERHRLSRGQFSRFLATRAPATVVMEACGTAHFWAREADARGHRVVLVPPHAVRPYVLRNKTDGADAKGLLEAVRNEAIRPVPVKSVDQHVLASLHRMRSAWLATRTARLNTVRGLLRELGLTIPVGARQVVPQVWALVSDAESPLPDGLRPVLAEAAREISALEVRIREVEHSLETMTRESEVLTRLRTIPGVGLLTATALVVERPAEAPWGNQQAGRPVSPHAPHPRRPVRAPACEKKEGPRTRSSARLGARSRTGARSQQGGRCARQQARPHRLGGLAS
jgi:transposase